MNRPRILFLAHLLPWPLEGGGQIKSYHTLRLLSSVADIHLLAFIRTDAERENIAPLESLCNRGITVVPLARGRVRDAVHALRSLVGRQSFIVSRDTVPEMETAVQRALAEGEYSAIHVDHLQMMPFVPKETPGVRVVLDNHNVEYRIPQRIAGTPGNPLVRWYTRQEWPKLRNFERDALRRADLTLAVSEEDAIGLRDLATSKADCIIPVPIGVDTEYFAPATRSPNSKTLLSIGTMFWPPNVDALRWFCAEIWPKVQARVPGVSLKIVGAKPTAAIRALAESNPSIIVTGSVPDVRPYAEDCAAFIVPLRSGSGMRVKILNALSMGLPVVSTTVGAEGIAVQDGEHLLLADTPDAFAKAVLRLLKDPALGERLGAAGRRLMEEQYSWEAVGRTLLGVYERRILGTEGSPIREQEREAA